MPLTTRADWEKTGSAEMGWRLTMAEPPATFAMCRHDAGWMKVFRLFVWSHGSTGPLEFLEAVDELRSWEPHGPMTREIYDRYVTGARDSGRKQITLSAPIAAALAEAFVAGATPDRASVFATAYREVMDRVDTGRYHDFLQMAQEVRTPQRVAPSLHR
jgi:hypothetical protein